MNEWNASHYTGERALFRVHDGEVTDCLFDDGESPLKETKNLEVSNTTFAWKYPLWYGENITVKDCAFQSNARAGIWYTNHASFVDCEYTAPKGFRRCDDITLKNIVFADALETLWWNTNVKLENIVVQTGDYFGMGCKNVTINHLELHGNYGFDHGENLLIRDSKLLTKDAFWNTKHVRLERCLVEGEYFGWNSEDITLVDCEIHSLQGFCYMKNIKLINCKVIDTDRAFEYCENIDADITTRLISIKNPISGRIVCAGYDELIRDDERLDQSKTEILIRG